MKRLVEATDEKIVTFAKSIYKVDVEDPNSTPWKGGQGSPLRGIVAAKAGLAANSSLPRSDKGVVVGEKDDAADDSDWREKLQRAESKHSTKMASVQEEYRTLGLHQPGTPDPIPISRGTVFASHLTTVHRHIRHFEHLLRWWLSDRTFPFAHHWIKQLLGAEVEDKDALEMMRTSAKTKSKTLQTEEARLLNINAYTELEESIVAHLNSMFLMLLEMGLFDTMGMGLAGSGSRVVDWNSGKPSMTAEGTFMASGSTDIDAFSTYRKEAVAPPIAASLTSPKGSASAIVVGADLPSVKVPEPPSFRPSTASTPLKRKLDRPSSGGETQLAMGNPSASAHKVADPTQGDALINLGISRVVCRPGSASAAQGSSVSIRPPSAGSSFGTSASAVQSPRLQHDARSVQSLRRGSAEESAIISEGAAPRGWQLLQEEPAQVGETNPSHSKCHSIRSPRAIMIAVAQRSGLSTHFCGTSGGREGPKGMDSALLPSATSTSAAEAGTGLGAATGRPSTASRFNHLQTKHLKQHEPVTGTVEGNNGVKAIQLSPRTNQRPASARETGTLWSFGGARKGPLNSKAAPRSTASDSAKHPPSQVQPASGAPTGPSVMQPVEVSTETVLTGGLADVGPLPIEQNPEALSAWGAQHPHWGPSRDLQWIQGEKGPVHQGNGKAPGGVATYRVM